MNKFSTIMKIVTALAAAIGAIYIVATYGDKIVQWAKSLVGCHTASVPAQEPKAEETVEDPTIETAEEAPAAQETVMEEAASKEAPEAPAMSEDAPIADEADFEG